VLAVHEPLGSASAHSDRTFTPRSDLPDD